MNFSFKNKNNIFVLIFVIIIFAILINIVVNNYNNIKNYKFLFQIDYLLLSFICTILGIFWLGIVWKQVITQLQPINKLSSLEAIKISTYSWLGRHIPGKVFPILGKIYFSDPKTVSAENIYLGSVYHDLLVITSAVIFSIGILSIHPNNLFNFGFMNVVLAVAFLIGLIVFTRSIHFFATLNFFLKKFGKKPLEKLRKITAANTIKLIASAFISHGLRGIGFYFFVVAFVGHSDIINIVGIFIFAGVIGVMAFFTPSGLGVKEGVIVLGLSLHFPLEIATVIALLTRIWEIIGDLVSVSGVFLYTKIKYKYTHGP